MIIFFFTLYHKNNLYSLQNLETFINMTFMILLYSNVLPDIKHRKRGRRFTFFRWLYASQMSCSSSLLYDILYSGKWSDTYVTLYNYVFLGCLIFFAAEHLHDDVFHRTSDDRNTNTLLKYPENPILSLNFLLLCYQNKTIH